MSKKQSHDWNDADVERLRALWERGHSTSDIARRMHISKNAVVGKAHRLGLEGRPNPANIRYDYTLHDVEIRALREQGRSYDYIAAKTAIGRQSVINRLKALGLDTPEMKQKAVFRALRERYAIKQQTDAERDAERLEIQRQREAKKAERAAAELSIRAQERAQPKIACPPKPKPAQPKPTHQPMRKEYVAPGSMCCFIIGSEGRTHFYCDKPVVGRSFCAEHFAICYQPSQRQAA